MYTLRFRAQKEPKPNELGGNRQFFAGFHQKPPVSQHPGASRNRLNINPRFASPRATLALVEMCEEKIIKDIRNASNTQTMADLSGLTLLASSTATIGIVASSLLGASPPLAIAAAAAVTLASIPLSLYASRSIAARAARKRWNGVRADVDRMLEMVLMNCGTDGKIQHAIAEVLSEIRFHAKASQKKALEILDSGKVIDPSLEESLLESTMSYYKR